MSDAEREEACRESSRRSGGQAGCPCLPLGLGCPRGVGDHRVLPCDLIGQDRDVWAPRIVSAARVETFRPCDALPCRHRTERISCCARIDHICLKNHGQAGIIEPADDCLASCPDREAP